MSGHCHVIPDGGAIGSASEPATESAFFIGEIEKVAGPCALTRSGDNPVQVKHGDPVCQGDIIETAADGKVSIRFIDGTVFNLSDRGRIVLKEFAGGGVSPSALFDVSGGTFAFIAGEMAKAGRLNIDTPFASIRSRNRVGGIGMLSLASLFFSALEDAQAKDPDVSFLDDGQIRFRDLTNDYGVVELALKTFPPRTIFVDDPGETIVLRQVGSSITESYVTNSLAQMLQYQGDQQNVLRTFSLGLSGPASNGPGGSSTSPLLEFVPPAIPINNFVPLDHGGLPIIPAVGGGTSNGSGTPPEIFIPQPPPAPPPPPAAPGAINELFNQTGDTTLDSTTGTLVSTGLSVGAPSFAWSAGNLTPGQQTALAAASTLTFGGTNPNDFTFSVTDKALDFLAVNETLTVTYNVTTSGGSTQAVTVTVFGTNDTPKLTAPPPQQVPELTGKTNDAADPDTAVGTLPFTDTDLTDTHTVGTSLVSAIWSGGGTLPIGLSAVLASALSTTEADSTGTGAGSVGFKFSAADKNFDFLAAGETLTVTYNVTVTDSDHVSTTQPVTITITGTEDAPVITSGAQSGLVTEDVDGSANENNEIHHQSGTVTLTDVDLSDIETGSFTLKQLSSTLANGYTLTQAQHDALVNAFTIDAATHSNVTGNGTIGWHYDIADSALDFLGTNDQVTLTYTVQTDDGHGGTTSQDVTITVHGTEDAPVITSGAQSGLVTEDVDGSANENNEIHHQSGTVTLTDVDLSDIETSSIANTQLSANLANGYTLTQAQHDALVNAFTIDAATHSNVTGNGTIGWHYDIADSALDFLGANDQVTLTYTVQTDDGHGGTTSQDVTITVHGTEDAPVITSGAQSGLVTEDVDGSANENNEIHHQSGTVTLTDVDLSDIETSSIANTQLSANLANGYTLTQAQHDALVNAFTIDAATHSNVTGNGTIGWHYDIADSALDFLGTNDQVTLTYTVQTDDGHGGTASQDVTITVHGTEDAPVITSGAQSGLVTEDVDGSANENNEIHHQSGTVTLTDVDLSDIETGSFTLKQLSSTLANGYTLTQAQHDALVNAFTIDAATHSNVTGNGTIGWHYDIADSALDFLGTNDQVTLTYTVQTDDGHGGTTSQDVTITVHGTEDAPVITSGAQSGLVTEDVDGSANENNEIHHQSGTVTLTDVDLSDIETSSIANTQLSANLANGYTLTQAQHDALVNAFTIDAATHSNVTGNGTIGWHYDIADSALDFLGANDQVTLTYTVQTDDGHGGTASQDVTITVHGTEDAPVITSGAQSGLVTEDVDGSANENNEIHHQSGTVTLTDVDLSDIETGSFTLKQLSSTLANGYTLTQAQHDALVNAFTIDAATHSNVTGNGTIGWHYDIADSALDFLGTNDQVTLTYTVQTDDGHGGIASQDVTITVHGTEDKPVVSAPSNPFAELPGTNNPNTDTIGGAVNFADVDASDRPTVAAQAPFDHYSYLAADGTTVLTLTAAQQTALEKTLVIASNPGNTNNGSASWTYSVADKALDFLAQNETLTLTYIATVNDHNGGIVTQPINVTIIGTNDVPVLTLDHHYNIQDQFNSAAYNLNTGSVNWATNWTESNEPTSNPATTGDIQITGGHLSFSGNGDWIQRTANLTGATSAIFSFDSMRIQFRSVRQPPGADIKRRWRALHHDRSDRGTSLGAFFGSISQLEP